MNDDLRATLTQFAKPIGIAVTATIALLALYLLVLTASTINRFDENQQNTIMVTGVGRSVAVPDIARITFSIEETAPSVADAQAAATAKMDAALSAVEALGIAKEDVRTVGYTVYPQYENQQPCFPGPNGICPTPRSPRITGYQVSQSVQVTVRDTAVAGDVLSSLGGLEVRNITGPNFTVDDESDVAAAARELAIKDAQEQAKRLAKQLGVRLGDVVNFYEEGRQPAYGMGMGGERSMMMDTAAPMPSPQLPVGEQEREVRVQIMYRIH